MGFFGGREIGRGEGRTGRSIVCRSHCWFYIQTVSELVYDYQAEGLSEEERKFTKSPAIDLPQKISRISIHFIPYFT